MLILPSYVALLYVSYNYINLIVVIWQFILVQFTLATAASVIAVPMSRPPFASVLSFSLECSPSNRQFLEILKTLQLALRETSLWLQATRTSMVSLETQNNQSYSICKHYHHSMTCNSEYLLCKAPLLLIDCGVSIGDNPSIDG